ELNILFARLLREVGFQVELLSSQVANEDGVFGPEFGHPVALVTLEERWIADVGNSRWFPFPLRLDDPGPQPQQGRIYHVRPLKCRYTVFQTDREGRARPQYRFTLQPRQIADFQPMCAHLWTSSESRYTQGYICALLTPQGRILLTNRRFVLDSEGKRSER